MNAHTITTLGIHGYDGPVPNAFWTIDSDTLLIMLPGLGYTNDMPLMFYLHELAMARSWDVLQVNYDYRRVPRETPNDEWAKRMLADVQPTIEAALATTIYRQVILAGKSIGTRVMTTLLQHGFDRATAYVWLTPLLRVDNVRNAVMANAPSVAVFGSEDFAVADVDLTPIGQAGTSIIIMPKANHGMMIDGAVVDSIAALADSFRQLDTWLDDNVSAAD